MSAGGRDRMPPLPPELRMAPQGQQQAALQVVAPLNDAQMVMVLATLLWAPAQAALVRGRDAFDPQPDGQTIAEEAVRLASAVFLEAVVQVIDNNSIKKGLDVKRTLARNGGDT